MTNINNKTQIENKKHKAHIILNSIVAFSSI